jgi:hypothetical protein
MDVRRMLGALVAATAVACGGAGDGEGSATVVDACSLLAAAEIGAMLGLEIGEPHRDQSSTPGDPGSSACSWPVLGDDRFPSFVKVSVSANATSSPEEWLAEVAREKGEPADPVEYPQVDGIGDWAVYADEDRTLTVAVGPRLVHVTVDLSSSGVEAIAVTRVVLRRLAG